MNRTFSQIGMGIALASLLMASPAWAQKPKTGGKPAPAPTTPAPSSGGDTLEIDDPNAPKTGSDTTTPAATSSGVGVGTAADSGGICAVDPTACAKGPDIAGAAKREVAAEVYAVQQIYALRARRLEIMPYWAFSLNDQFVSHPGPGLGVNYYLTNALAVGVNGTYYGPFNVDSDFNFQNRRATRVAVPLNEYLVGYAFNATYVPVYGKFAGFSNFIFHYDLYVVGGIGATHTRPIAVIDPDNRKFDWDLKLTFNAGVGLRIFFNRWFAADLELRDYIYNERLENLRVGATQKEQQDPNTWLGDRKITNNVQAQLGITIFLPTSWQYRLPK